jgi:rhodanese-related sulfurtransferase
MLQAVQRALLTIVLGAGLGLLANALSPKGIPLITPPKKAPKLDQYIPLQKAHELWEGGGTLFLDARNPEDFEAGHIAKALNFPAERFEEYYPKLGPMLSSEAPVVVYCDGTECELSHRLAKQLHDVGSTNVHMLYNGYSSWKGAGFPLETNTVK